MRVFSRRRNRVAGAALNFRSEGTDYETDRLAALIQGLAWARTCACDGLGH